MVVGVPLFWGRVSGRVYRVVCFCSGHVCRVIDVPLYRSCQACL